MTESARIDAGRLENFRQELARHRELTRAGLDRMNGSLARLANSWKDEQYNRFRGSMGRTSERLGLFLEHTAKQLVHLEELVKASREVERGDLRGDR